MNYGYNLRYLYSSSDIKNILARNIVPAKIIWPRCIAMTANIKLERSESIHVSIADFSEQFARLGSNKTKPIKLINTYKTHKKMQSHIPLEFILQ